MSEPASPEPSAAGLRRLLLDVEPLRTSPAFRRLWAGQSLSGFGAQMTLVAVMVQVWQTTGSTVWTGAVSLAQAVPLIALGLFAGSLADRLDRRTFYLAMTAGETVCSLLLALQAVFGHVPIAALLGVVALQSCFGAGGSPASRTFIPHLLPARQRAAGLALTRIGFQGALLGGPALGGVLAGGLGVSACYLVDTLTFAAALYAAFRLPPMPPGDTPARPGVRGVLDGLAFLGRSPVVRGALLTDLAAMVLGMSTSLFPLVNAERFGDDPRTLGLFLTAFAVGGVLASALSGTFTRFPRPGQVMIVGSAGWGASMVLFGLSPDAWTGLGCLVLGGAADTLAVVSRSTVVQTHTPTELLGRVSAAEQIVGQAGPNLGNMRAGLVARAYSGTTALVSGGVLCLAAVAVIAVTTSELRSTTTPEAAPEAASAGP